MCQRKQDEPAWAYVFRMACEQPRGVLSIIGLVLAGVSIFALGYIYVDTSKRSERQTEAYLEVTKVLAEVQTELRATREAVHQLDAWHKQAILNR